MQNQVTGFRLSPQQKRLWLLAQDGLPARAACAVRLEGPLRPDALRDALHEVIARHEILRTRFERAPGITLPIQVISEAGAAAWHEHSLADLAPREQAERVEAFFVEETRAGLQTSEEPAVRATLLELAGQSHLLLLSLPALSADARSMENLVGELARAYAAGGEASDEEEGPTQYLQFSEWQNELLKEEEAEEGRRFWRQLDAAAAALSIPFERPAAAGGFAPRSVEVELDDVPARRLEEVAAGARPADFMLACWQALLWRLTGEPSLVVGRAFENRKFDELSGALGPFAGFAPVAARLDEDVRFGEALRRADEASRAAEEWQEYFEWESLGAPSSSYLSFLFEFSGRGAGRRAAGVNFSLYKHEVCGERFKVKLSCAAGGDALAARLEYDSSIYGEADILRLGRQLRTLVAAALADPEARLGDLEVLDEEERRRLLVEWNQTRAEFPAERCFHELFELQARRTPDAIAVIAGDARLNYAELNGKANQLAHQLRASGVGPDVLVGVMLERSVETVVALLGVLKAGGAYLPLDPQQPAQRLSFQLEDAGARLVLTQQRLLGNLPGEGVEALCLDSDWERVAARSVDDPEPLAVPANLAYVIYTSGSTGQPKGVMIPHRGLVNYLSWCARAYRVAEGAGAPVHSSIGFDLTITGLFAPLLSGRSVTLLPEANAVEALAEALAAGGDFSLVKITPAHLELLAGLLPEGGAAGSARALVIGGEALTSESLNFWREHAPGTRLINEYGPTETVVGCSIYEVGAEQVLPAVVPIGRPVANTQMYVLDARLRPLPPGVTGEIYVGGEGLARGYKGRPGLTAERFVPNPFGAGPGERLYRTGDLGRFLPDGEMEFLGRLDQQVKVRGFRIELGEIEAVLGRHPSLKEAVVMAREDVAGDKRLVAYCVGRQGREPSAAELREHLQAALPDYMIPTAFVMLRALPLTPNGKVDRKALPAPDTARPELRGGYVAPRTPVEEMLAETWASVLGLKRVGVHDNFFELGGHSLLATQLMSRVHKCFEVEVPLRGLFDGPTIAELARKVEQELGAGTVTKAEPILPQPRGGEAPLSYAQQRLWFLDRMAPGTSTYNVPLAARLDGPLDLAALRRTLSEVVRRHEVLRTTYPERGGRPVQAVGAAAELPLEVTDLSNSTDPEAEAARLDREEALRPFDLSEGPVVRARLLRVSAESHLLLVTLHHIASDGWSASILLREVAALYDAFARGLPSPLPEPEWQYADYSQWQRRLFEGGGLDAELDYWRERLRGAEVLRLPGGGGGPRPGGVYRQHLPVELIARLRELGGSEGTTLFMTLLAGFDALLYRLTGQEDLVVGTPVAGRTRLEFEGVVGCFVNTLAVRVEAAGGPSFVELLRRVREAALGAYAHQGAPFERVVEAAAPGREAGREPLLRVVFVMQNAPREELRLGGLGVSRVAEAGVGVLVGAGAKFDLTVSVEEEAGGGGVRVGWEWREGVWGEGEAERVAGCYERLLRAAAREPLREIRRLELLDPEQRLRSLSEWQGRAELKQDARWGGGRDRWLNVVEVVGEVARLHGDAPAVADAGRELSYAELDAESNRAARLLRGLGVGPESRVGVVLERSAEMVVWLLAVMKAGGAYVPVEAESPAARRRWVLEDAGVGVVVTQSALAGELAGHGWQVVEVGGAVAESARLSAEPFECPARDENPAYVIYTSGSTGRPKGVAVTHRGLRNLIRWHQRAFRVTAEDRATQVASVAFDATVWELWPYLSAGASVLVPEEETRRSPERLREWLLSNNVTVTFLPTPLAESVLALEWPAESALRIMLTGGDQLHHHAPRRLGFELVNNYGPTENTVVATSGVVAFVEDAARMPPIGRPIDNTQVYILDTFLEPVPPGLTGELYIGGQSLARGYHNRAALTAERFVPNPFNPEPGARMYRTGDLGRFLPDGEIEFAGRADQQVKIRGFRIELGEIEALLEQHPAVSEAAVQAHQSARGDKRLAAYVVPAPGHELQPQQLREYLGERVPGYMLPTAYVPLERLPLTPNGKLDRRALPVPEQAQAGHAGDSGAPRTFVEETLVQMWADTLEVERVGVNDNFFELGGHSLLATRLISLISEAFHVPLPLRAFFESPTVAALAEQIEGAVRGRPGRQLPPLGRAPRDVAPELSYAQQRLWFLDRLEPDSCVYNVPLAVRLDGPLDLAALTHALREIVRRHEVLRTTYPEREGRPVQVIHPSLELPVEVTDVSGAADPEAEAARLAREESRRPFDLAAGPILRARLLRLAEGRHLALLTMHHIASDGWSMGVLLREIAALYAALAAGQSSPLAELTLQYADFAHWQHELLEGGALDWQLDYWRGQLSGAEPLRLATDYARPESQSFRGARKYFELPPSVADGVRALCRAEGVTPFMLLLAAFKWLLSRYTGQEEIVVGTSVANRTSPEAQQMLGCFFNQLALRTTLNGNPTFRETLARVREVVLEAYAHQEVPFEKVVEAVQPERLSGGFPLFQIFFGLDHTLGEDFGLPGLTLSVEEVETAATKFDLLLVMKKQAGAIGGTLEYNTDLFRDSTVARFLDQFQLLLAEVVGDPGRELHRINLATETEARGLIHAFNDDLGG